jgi:hypothetical protein
VSATAHLSALYANPGANTRLRTEVTAVPGAHEPRLSGIGRQVRNGRYIGPPNYDARWDDEGYQFPDSDEFQMGGGPYSDRHTFIMHAHCCSLLEQFFHPRPIPLARLVEVCRSCPVQGNWFLQYLSWGVDHSYGWKISPRNGYPWEEQPDDWVPHKIGSHPRPQNPWNVPKLSHPELMRYPQRLRRLDAPTQTRRKRSRRARSDPWTRTRRNKAARAKRYSAKLYYRRRHSIEFFHKTSS